MIKYVVKVADKLFVPIIVLNMMAIGSVFYNRGKLDALADMEAVKEAAKEVVEAVEA